MADDRKQAFEAFAETARKLGEADGFKEVVMEWKKDRDTGQPTKRDAALTLALKRYEPES